MKNLRQEALLVAFQNQAHLDTKAYWFKAWGILRQSGVIAFFAWASNKVGDLAKPGPLHQHLINLCGATTVEELFNGTITPDMAVSLQLQEAIGIFEAKATGERTDHENYPTNRTWRV